MKRLIIFLLVIYLLTGCTEKQSHKNKDIEVNEVSPMFYSESLGNQRNYLESEIESKEFNTEEYDLIKENQFLNVLENPLSTFSIDVDTASYSNFRRFLDDGRLPPIDSVRIEEFVNYFKYDYKNPENDKFSINAEMGECYWNKKHKLLKIGLKGKELIKEDVPNSNIVFLIDVSGSMSEENKLPLLKKSFKLLVDKLEEKDKVSIVVYAGNSGVVLNSVSGSQKDKIETALENLFAGGSTAGGEGIELAYKIAKENFIKNGNNRVILATDGDFNIGKSSNAELERLIESKRDEGIYLTVLGFGMGNYKDSKMENLSNAGDGNYAYIDNLLEAKKVLGDEFFGTMFTIAKDVKIQIEFNPSKIKAYKLIGYENRMLNKEDFNDDKKDAGEVGAGHTITAFYEIIPMDSDEELSSNVEKLEYQSKTEIIESDNFITFKLRYKESAGDESKLILKRFKEEEIYYEIPSIDFKFASSVAELGLILRDSQFKSAANIDNLIKRARENKGVDLSGDRAEFVKLSEKVKLLKK